MAKLANLARMSTSTTGTGTITLGSAVTGFLSFASAGVTDGQTVSYAIEDGNSREVGRGVYTSSGTTLTRSVLVSTNSNSAINLSGNAQVFLSALAEDFAPTGTTSGRLVRYTDTNGTLGQTTGIYEDGSGNLGVGTTAPTSKATLSNNTANLPTPTAGTILHLGGADSSSARIVIDSFGTSVSSNLTGRRARGTASSPSAVQTGDQLINFAAFGYGAAGYSSGTRGGFIIEAAENWTDSAQGTYSYMTTTPTGSSTFAIRFFISSSGNIGLGGTTSPSYLLTLSTDSAAKPSTNTWTISSDVRLKENIISADLARCWDIVKGIPLKRYTWRSDVYTQKAVSDRSKLGWIAQDVQPFFGRAVDTYKFEKVAVEDGVETYEEQATEERTITREVQDIEMRGGAAVLVAKTVTSKTTEPVFDNVAIVDEQGNPVVDADGLQLFHKVPRMITKTRPKMRVDTIDDCLSLNADQIYAAMYGALQLAMARIENLENALGQFVSHIESQSP